MIERLEFDAVPVGTIGTFVIGTLTNVNPALRFVVYETGVIKGIGNWTTPPQLSIGTNAIANSLMVTQNLTIIPLRGRNESEPTIWAFASGTDIRLRVTAAGVVSAGVPLVDAYIIGIWTDITSV